MKEKFADRYGILAISIILMVMLIVLQLANLQIVKGGEYDEMSQRKLLKERRVIAPRGNIVDRYGVPIAVNSQGFTVELVKTKIEPDALNLMLLKIANIFEKNNDAYYRSLGKYININPFSYGTAINQSETKLNKWLGEMAVKQRDLEQLTSPEQVFKYLRDIKFKIGAGYTDEEAYKIMGLRYEMLIRGYSALNPLSLAKNVSKETVAELEEKQREFPGVTTGVEPMRKYIDAQAAAHLIGYLGNINENDYKRLKDEGYGMNDLIGQKGVERSAEKYLKGKDGLKRIEVDISGRLTEELNQNPATPGNDVYLTIDMKLQKTAMESLENKITELNKMYDGKKYFGDTFAGSVVAMDVNTGEILAMASYPSFDPSVFLKGSDDKEAEELKVQWLTDNQNKPTRNRAIQDIFAPGSTFKPLVGIASLEEGALTPNERVLDEGETVIGGWNFKCLEYRDYGWAHGYLNLKEALGNSCNIFFHKIGVRTGIDNLDKWAKYFGLGEKTGIDVDSESEAKGIRANKEYKKTVYKDDWRPADTAQASIGQIFHAYTPLQLTNYTASIANGGKRFKPYLIKKVTKYDGSLVMETSPEFEQIPVKEETIRTVKAGMVAVANANDGTAVDVFRDFKFKVAGKTGTAETGERNHSSNGLFIAYAPENDPKIAVAVVIERGAWGANASPVVKDILAEYFNLNGTAKADDRIKPEDAVFTR